MNKYIFRDSNNGHGSTFIVFESDSILTNEIHEQNINSLSKRSRYGRIGESFGEFKSDCKEFGIKINEIWYGDFKQEIPREFKNLEIIEGISGNY